MIVLDTNVISEPLKADPDKRVLAWLDDQVAETLCTTAVNYAEQRPQGRERRGALVS